MAISMWVRKEMPERGDRLDEGALPWAPPRDALNLRETPLLAAVDPTGDTVFNRFQLEMQLPQEIAYLRQHLHGRHQLAMLDELERLATVATAKIHRYLWFIGD